MYMCMYERGHVHVDFVQLEQSVICFYLAPLKVDVDGS